MTNREFYSNTPLNEVLKIWESLDDDISFIAFLKSEHKYIHKREIGDIVIDERYITYKVMDYTEINNCYLLRSFKPNGGIKCVNMVWLDAKIVDRWEVFRQIDA